MTGTQHQAASTGAPGEPFGPYEVYERLGVGGMATVHRAIERGIEGFERVVALKRLLPHLAEDAEFVRSFVREAKLASQLQHINICQLYELGRVGSTYFISMEYIEGRDVRQILRQGRRVTGPPPIEVTVAILSELCDALDYAHTCTDDAGEPLGLVHRDVSPSNLLLASSGHLKIIDFGIAKATSHKLRTQTGRVKGKLAYMSPEAIRGATLDSRSDVFSVGVIAYELLTAAPLFASKNDYETLTRIQQRDVDPPSAKNSSVTEDLDRIVLKLLAKNPDERFASAGDVRDALEEVRLRHQLNATNRTARAWVDAAFASGAAQHERARRPSASGPSEPRASSASPVGASPVGASPMEAGAAQPAAGGAAEDAVATAGEVATSAEVGGAAAAREEDEGAAEASGARDASGAPDGVADPDAGAEAGHSLEGDGDGAPDAALEVEEEAADIAWGEEDGAPVILDEVPDVSHKRPLRPATPPPPPAAEALAASAEEDGEPTQIEDASAPRAPAPGALVASAPGGASEGGAAVSMSGAAAGDRERAEALGDGAVRDEPRPKVWPDGTTSSRRIDVSKARESGEAREAGDPAPSARSSASGRPSSSSIGTTIVARDPSTRKPLAIGGAALGAAGLGLGALLLFGGSDDGPAAGPTADEEESASATDGSAGAGGEEGAEAELTFAIHPEGAEIRIDDEPLEADQMPHEMAIEPGTYRVEIAKSGYESWVEEIELEAGQSRLIHEQLEEGGGDMAVVRVSSRPSDLEATLDGEELAERTPFEIEVEPGERRLEVEDGGGTWSEEFEAEANTVYAFHATVEGDDARSSPAAPAAADGSQRIARAGERTGAGTGEEGRAAADAGDGVGADSEEETQESARPNFDFGRDSFSAVSTEAPAEPPGRREARDSDEPVRTSADDMVRLSGARPAVPSRASSRVSEATVDLCVDTSGNVTGVTVTSSPGVEIERALRRDLRTWRFRPYRDDAGDARAACFEHEIYLR